MVNDLVRAWLPAVGPDSHQRTVRLIMRPFTRRMRRAARKSVAGPPPLLRMLAPTWTARRNGSRAAKMPAAPAAKVLAAPTDAIDASNVQSAARAAHSAASAHSA